MNAQDEIARLQQQARELKTEGDQLARRVDTLLAQNDEDRALLIEEIKVRQRRVNELEAKLEGITDEQKTALLDAVGRFGPDAWSLVRRAEADSGAFFDSRRASSNRPPRLEAVAREVIELAVLKVNGD